MAKAGGKKAGPVFFEQVTRVYLLLMAAVFPLFCGFRGYQAITGAKFGAFCVLCGGYAAVMLLLALEGFLIGAVKPVSPLRLWKAASWAQRFIVLYLLLTWVSALASPWFPETVVGVSRYEGALTISLYGLCFLLVSVYGRADRALLAVFAAAVTLFCLLCLVQLAGYNPFGLYPAGTTYQDAFVRYAGAYLGTIGNVDLVAAFLCLSVGLFWGALLRLSGRLRFLLALPLALSLFVLGAMRVAAGLVGTALGALLALPVVLPAGKRTRLLTLAGVLALLLAGVIFLRFVDMGSGTLHEAHLLLRGEASESFGSGRLRIWRAVAEKLPERLLLGAGPDTMLRAGLEPFRRYDAALGGVIVTEIDAAHNEYLNVLYHQGLFALVAYLAALGFLLRRWLTKSRADGAAALLGAGALCYAIQALFGISMCLTAPFFILTLALLEGRGRAQEPCMERRRGRVK